MTQQSKASADDVIRQLKAQGSTRHVEGMSRFGIQTSKALGVSLPQLRQIGRKLGQDHDLAQELWKTGFHEARILASMIDIPEQVTMEQMERWAKEFDSWDIVDGCCGNLFDKTPFAVKKAKEWRKRPEEYVKRAGFVLMAGLAVHDKRMPDKTFLEFLLFIIEGSSDERNFVKKAVNWALRQIGKRNKNLNNAAIRTARVIAKSNIRPAKWIASDAIRELESPAVQKKLL
ncbi:MAG TPA: DNA alkylation repair protein [Candidatus Bathyarchaeia archaeon]|nr:DNA alkylation repair protein [Candidatus Bathyarchaeia archaeon]